MAIEAWLVPVMALALIVLERLPRTRRLALPLLRRGWLTDLVLLALGLAILAPLGIAWVRWASTTLGHAGWPGVPIAAFALQLVVALVLIDLGNYTAHWAMHRFPVLWRFHQVHHSSRRLDWLATFRAHLVDQLVRRLVAPLFAIAIGLPVAPMLAAGTILLAWAMLGHSNLAHRPSRIETVLITPRLHRVHHVAASSESNLGTLFVWWDRLLGRLELRTPLDSEALGVPGAIDRYPQSLFGLLRAPFQATNGR